MSEPAVIAEMYVMGARECWKHGNPISPRLVEILREIIADPDGVPGELIAEIRRLLAVGQA